MFPLFQKQCCLPPLFFNISLRDTHPFFSTPWGFITFQNACSIFSDLYSPPCVAKKFQFLVFTLENELNLCICTHAPVPHSKLQIQFFKKSVSAKAKNKGVEDNYDLLY